MKITLEMLKEKKACSKGIEYFKSHWVSGEAEHTEILEQLSKDQDEQAYGTWLLTTFKLTGTSYTYGEENSQNVWCYTEFENGVKIKSHYPIKVKK